MSSRGDPPKIKAKPTHKHFGENERIVSNHPVKSIAEANFAPSPHTPIKPVDEPKLKQDGPTTGVHKLTKEDLLEDPGHLADKPTAGLK